MIGQADRVIACCLNRDEVAVQQASEPCCGTGEMVRLSGRNGFGPVRHPGVAVEESAEGVDLSDAHFVAVER